MKVEIVTRFLHTSLFNPRLLMKTEIRKILQKHAW